MSFNNAPAAANNVELAHTPHYASWLNRIEGQFEASRYFALDGTPIISLITNRPE